MAGREIKIAPGTHAGKVLRLGGKGLPDVNGYGRGDDTGRGGRHGPRQAQCRGEAVGGATGRTAFLPAGRIGPKDQNIFDTDEEFLPVISRFEK